MPFNEDVTLDEHGNANMSWHCAGVRVSSPRSMLNLKSFIVFSVDQLSRAEQVILNCQTHRCQFIYLEEVLSFTEQHFGMVDTIFVYFILRTTGTCMMGRRNTQGRALGSVLRQLCFVSHWGLH